MRAAFYTLGCKVNQYETEYMAELLKRAGFEVVSHKEEADIYIVNSCTVTSTADQKTRQNIRKFKRKHPQSTVILTGCMPQAFPKEAEELIEADIVLSNRSNGDILDLINRYNTEHNRLIKIEKHLPDDGFEKCEIENFSERIRAFLKIEDGCDRFCSYCIIPMSRGRVRSKSPDDLKREVKKLAQNGIKEIVLVGINLSSYGKGEDFSLTDAVRICCEEEKILRVRLGSLEPDHITDELIEELSQFDKLCPQFHISLQSGCDKTLKAMNRHYLSDDYRHMANKIRSTFDGAQITTDVMTGFNDESEDDFNASLEFIKEIGFEKVHTFPYSERSGTAASRRGDSVPKAVKEERAAIVIKEAEKIREKYMASCINKTYDVLFESFHGDYIQGYTKNYIPVKVCCNSDLTGEEKAVTIKAYDSKSDICKGEFA